jgi:hypothetical protein
MFCQECGAKLKEKAKFCGGCGAKVELVEHTPENQTVDSIPLAPLPEGVSMAIVPIEILEVSGEGPDGENNLNVTVKCKCTNESGQDWNLFKVRTQLLNAFGHVIEEVIDTYEELIESDSDFEWESSFWSVNADLLGSEPEKAHVVVFLTVSRAFDFTLDQVSMPETDFSSVNIAAKSMDAIQMVSCSLWKTAPDDDQESRIEIRCLVQNLTNINFPLVRLLCEISDKNKQELATGEGENELRAGQLITINSNTYGEDKKFTSATAALAMSLYFHVANGIQQRQGIDLVVTEIEESVYEEQNITEDQDLELSGKIIAGENFSNLSTGASMNTKINMKTNLNNIDKEYVLSIVADDEGVSNSMTYKGEDCSWEDNLRNWLSVGAQYIISKTLEELECNVSDWSKGELEQYFTDRLSELIALRSVGFIAESIDFSFIDSRASREDEDVEDAFSPVEGYRKN